MREAYIQEWASFGSDDDDDDEIVDINDKTTSKNKIEIKTIEHGHQRI